MELVHRNAASLVSPPRNQRREVVPPDIAAVRDAPALAEREELSLLPCIHLLAYTGMRRGEALGLRSEDMDMDGGYLQVVSSLVRTRERELSLTNTKVGCAFRGF